MNTSPHVEITDQFISRLISSTDAAGSRMASASEGAHTPAADPGDNPAHAITQWAHSHSEVPAYN